MYCFSIRIPALLCTSAYSQFLIRKHIKRPDAHPSCWNVRPARKAPAPQTLRLLQHRNPFTIPYLYIISSLPGPLLTMRIGYPICSSTNSIYFLQFSGSSA